MRNFVVTVNGKQYEVGVEEVGGDVQESRPAVAFSAAPAASAPAAPQNGTKVLSPFPGLIKSLAVENGAKVKMDNDISAPCDGTVTFQVAKGANVESDTVLAVIS